MRESQQQGRSAGSGESEGTEEVGPDGVLEVDVCDVATVNRAAESRRSEGGCGEDFVRDKGFFGVR